MATWKCERCGEGTNSSISCTLVTVIGEPTDCPYGDEAEWRKVGQKEQSGD